MIVSVPEVSKHCLWGLYKSRLVYQKNTTIFTVHRKKFNWVNNQILFFLSFDWFSSCVFIEKEYLKVLFMKGGGGGKVKQR